MRGRLSFGSFSELILGILLLNTALLPSICLQWSDLKQAPRVLSEKFQQLVNSTQSKMAPVPANSMPPSVPQKSAAYVTLPIVIGDPWVAITLAAPGDLTQTLAVVTNVGQNVTFQFVAVGCPGAVVEVYRDSVLVGTATSVDDNCATIINDANVAFDSTEMATFSDTTVEIGTYVYAFLTIGLPAGSLVNIAYLRAELGADTTPPTTTAAGTVTMITTTSTTTTTSTSIIPTTTTTTSTSLTVTPTTSVSTFLTTTESTTTLISTTETTTENTLTSFITTTSTFEIIITSTSKTFAVSTKTKTATKTDIKTTSETVTRTVTTTTSTSKPTPPCPCHECESDDRFWLVASYEAPYYYADDACASVGGRLAVVTESNRQLLAQLLYDCSGPYSQAWVQGPSNAGHKEPRGPGHQHHDVAGGTIGLLFIAGPQSGQSQIIPAENLSVPHHAICHLFSHSCNLA